MTARRPRAESAGRAVQAGFLLLFAVCVLQAAWWIVDEIRYTADVRASLLDAYGREVEAARALHDGGMPPGEIERMFPDVTVDGTPPALRLDPAIVAALDADRARRLNRFIWEGVFFLAVLVAGMAILVRTLRRDTELRRRQENFLAAVSHELRSPLASLRLGLDTLTMRDPPPESRQRVLNRFGQEIDRLDRMISNMLETRRIEEGGARIAPERIDVGEAVRRVVASREARAESAGLSVTASVPGGAVLNADPAAFDSVIGNLLDNAIAACEGDAGERIAVTVTGDVGALDISVSDDGRGFEPREAARLFDKFYRPGDELRRTAQGSGLGLYLVRRLAEAHGGEVRAESGGPGRGARFVVRWPVEPAR